MTYFWITRGFARSSVSGKPSARRDYQFQVGHVPGLRDVRGRRLIPSVTHSKYEVTATIERRHGETARGVGFGSDTKDGRQRELVVVCAQEDERLRAILFRQRLFRRLVLLVADEEHGIAVLGARERPAGGEARLVEELGDRPLAAPASNTT